MPPPDKILGDRGGGPGPVTAEIVVTVSDEFDRAWDRDWDRQAEKENSLRRPSLRPLGEGETATKGRPNEGDTERQGALHSSAGKDVEHGGGADSEDRSEDMVAEKLMTRSDDFDRAWDKSWQRERLKGLGAPRAGASGRAGHAHSRQGESNQVEIEKEGRQQETSTSGRGYERRYDPRSPRDEAIEVFYSFMKLCDYRIESHHFPGYAKKSWGSFGTVCSTSVCTIAWCTQVCQEMATAEVEGN